MKKTELVTKLNEIAALTKAADMREQINQLLEQIGPVTETEPGKIEYFITLGEKKIDPAMKYPRQMLECYDIIAEGVNQGDTVSRATVMELIGTGAERLKTRQSPERIYTFYQKQMEDAGWITRSQERIEA